MKLYLAGPMTGIPHFNFPVFKERAAQLRAAGHEVFSPAEHDIETNGENFHADNPEGDTKKAETKGFSLRGALRADLDWICDHAEGVYMLPGWENSRGARTEHALAVTLGLKVIYGTSAEPLAAVRDLVAELNANAASGLITQRALVLINVVQRELSRVKG